MDKLRKHWISLKQARAEQVGWENKWYAWYYPYSRVISITKGFIIGISVSACILGIMSIVNYFG